MTEKRVNVGWVCETAFMWGTVAPDGPPSAASLVLGPVRPPFIPAWPASAPLPPPRAIVIALLQLQNVGTLLKSSTNRSRRAEELGEQKMLELKPRPIVSAPQSRPVDKSQPRRLVLALVLLLVALIGVVVKDRQFWFGGEPSALDSDAADSATASLASTKAISPNAPAPKLVSAPAHRAQTSSMAPAKTQTSAATSSDLKPADAPAITTTRTVIPPLDVEVVAGDNHRTIRPGSNATKVEITRPGQPDRVTSATNAAERESLSADAQQPSYPLLAQHMNVQGSVVLQAVIGADGVIQDLHVITGPTILANAAQQAVREWHFKPILQHGQAVETKARITVNFNIKVADGTGTTLAETRTEGIQILSR